jgi:hypothetical protein
LRDSLAGQDRIQLFPNIVSVENLYTGNLPGDNVKNQHSILRHQAHISMTGTEAYKRLELRVKRAADVVSAAATFQNCQPGNLGSQFGFALLFEELAKLGCEDREYVS